MSKKVVIIGGMGGGTAVATKLRRLDEFAEIIIFEKSSDISIASCSLPYYIGDTIKERDKLLVETLSELKDIYNINVRINSEVISIDTEKKKIAVASIGNSLYSEDYDYLVLSPGASVSNPNIKSIDNRKVFKLRDISDADLIKEFIDRKEIKSAAIMGGDEIGIELAENLKERGLDIKLIESSSHILPAFDSDMAVFGQREVMEHGIDLMLNSEINAIEEKNNRLEITLNNGIKFHTDMLILTSRLKPNTDFLRNSGISLNTEGYIIVNDKMETNIDKIYAIGDCIETQNFVNNQPTISILPNSTIKQARVAAHNIADINRTYHGALGTSSIKVFNLTYAITGSSETILQQLRIPYRAVYLHSQSHDSSYPNSTALYLKLIFNDEGKILGAQASGYDSVDKRIDVIAATIRLGGTISELSELELSYAPPYSSSTDPVNMAGYIAENILRGRTSIIYPEDIPNCTKDNSIVIDVRSKLEYENGYLEGSINIPLDTLRKQLDNLDKNKSILVYCQSGPRGYIAERILAQHGFKSRNLIGGYETYSSSKYATNKTLNDFYNSNIDSYIHALKERTKKIDEEDYSISLDVCGICCPGPLMKVNSTLSKLDEETILKVTASDPGFYTDIQAWCKRTNNRLLHISKEKGIITALIKKSKVPPPLDANTLTPSFTKENKTLIVFSGDLDKAIASFIIANGALSMGKKVTMFFTFWGLNIIRKPEKVSVTKNIIDKLFGFMMPRGSKNLKLSNMNMFGIGGKMIRMVMKKKNIFSLEELIKTALDNGVEIVACQMSMDVMGLKKEELIDGVKIGGVGYYLGETEDSNLNLFI